jgi:hypothetical protein
MLLKIKKRAWKGDGLYRFFVLFFSLFLLALAVYGIFKTIQNKNIPEIWFNAPVVERIWV